jgi:hypothetical protein
MVEPVLFERDKLVLILEVKQLMSFELPIDEEHRSVEPLRPDLEPKDSHSTCIIFVSVKELEADLILLKAGRLVAQERVSHRREGLLEVGVPAVAAELGNLDTAAAELA